MSTIVYAYGCRAPTEGADRIRQQIERAHRYQNVLVEIERERRMRYRAVLSSVGDVAALEARIAALVAQCDAARAALKARRAAERTRAPKDDGTITALRAAIRVLHAEHRELRLRIRTDPAIVERVRQVDEWAWARVREERSRNGLYWGTYLQVEAAVEAQRRGKMDPKFRRWTGEGQVAVQLIRGLAVADVWGGDTRLQIGPVPPGAWDPALPRGAQRRLRHTWVRIRVGSTDSREPVWATLPVMLHRPLPAAGRIKWAWILVRRIAGQTEYSLQITVEAPERPLIAPGPVIDAVAIDIGWRVRPDDELRVAYWRDTDGREGELTLADVGRAIWHTESLRGIRDREMGTVKAWLSAWLRTHEHPEWLRQRLSHLPLWRSSARLAGVALAWRAQRWAGDEGTYERVEAWRRQDRHLWEWEAHERRKTLLRRREQYRVTAADLARRYGTIVLEDLDLRPLARLPQPEEDSALHAAARANRVVAAVSELRACVLHAAARYQRRVVLIDPAHTTVTCHGCGDREVWDQAAELHHTCACGRRWDQDANATRNLLAAWRERSSDGGDQAGRSQDLSLGNHPAIPEEAAGERIG